MGIDVILTVVFNDRMGLGYEIFSLLKDEKINLYSMEAKNNEQMDIKFQATEVKVKKILDSLQKVSGVKQVRRSEMMPHEQREHELKTILNSVSEGVIAVDSSGTIKHMNPVAREIFNVTSEQVEGMNASELSDSELPILKSLQTGKGYSLKEVRVKKNNKTLHYFTSGVPILNEKGDIIGAVATIKDMKQVEEIISKVDQNKQHFNTILYQSTKMRKVVETAKLVAQGSSSVLLRGESGTGKELFAKAIHKESPRSEEAFVAINCGALPESLLESELFGYEDGSFTGALKGGKKGIFENAHKGTLFLDEVGELSPNMQARLLRVLQEGAVRRIGSNREITVDVRIIAATHRNLENMMKEGQFREDLYYRLNVIPIAIPPLRERKEDIPLIAQHLIKKISKKINKPEKFLSKSAFTYLLQSEWPGNVRQLENTLERLINVVNDVEITAQDFLDWDTQGVKVTPADEIVYKDEQIVIPLKLDERWLTLKRVVDEVERELISKVLESHDSSRKAGQILGVSNTTILNKIKKHQLYLN